MYPLRVARYGLAPAASRRASGPAASSTLPQPIWRLVGVASIGIGSGLFTASASPGLLVLAFAPALFALVTVAIHSTFGTSVPRQPSEDRREEADG